MTKDQLSSLNNVRATHASCIYHDHTVGSYHTHDITTVLDILKSQENKLTSVKADLIDLIDTWTVFERADVKSMVNSIIAFLETS